MITFSGLGDDATPPATAAMPVASTDATPVAMPISDADAFLLQTPNPTCSDVVVFLKPYWSWGGPQSDRSLAAQELVAKGVPQATVAAALNWLAASSQHAKDRNQLYGWLAVISAAASAFHGYRRSGKISSAILWFIAGGIFPVVTPVIALAQGFAQPKES